MNATINIKPSVIALLLLAVFAWLACSRNKKMKRAAATAPSQAKPVTPRPMVPPFEKPTDRPVQQKQGEASIHPRANPFRSKPLPTVEELNSKADAAAFEAMSAYAQERGLFNQ